MDELYINSVRERITGNKCPKCGKQIDGATGLSDEKYSEPPQPKPGDLSVCMYCGALLRYDEKLRSMLVPRAERRKMEKDPRFKKLVEICERVAAQHRRNIQ
jgi:hypothetical protein